MLCHFIVRFLNKLPFKNLRHCHRGAFISFYESNTGETVSKTLLKKWYKKIPKLSTLDEGQISIILQVLTKFNIDKLEALKKPQLFTINVLSMQNYGLILQECGVLDIKPSYLVHYGTLVRSRTIAQLKSCGCLPIDTDVVKNLKNCFSSWPNSHPLNENVFENKQSLIDIRHRVIQRYLEWRIDMTPAQYEKFKKLSNTGRHKSMSNIQEAIDIAENHILMTKESLRKNGFVIGADTTNTKLILSNVDLIAGLETIQALRISPGIIKNNYKSILRIKEILEEHGFSVEAQRRCLQVFCLHPDTVADRLRELYNFREFRVLKDHPRALLMVLYQDKTMRHLMKLRTESKQYFTLHQCIISKRVDVDVLGEIPRGCDIANLICSHLQPIVTKHLQILKDWANLSKFTGSKRKMKDPRKEKVRDVVPPIVTKELRFITNELSRVKYWNLVNITKVADNIELLRKQFDDHSIIMNVQILIYPGRKIQKQLDAISEAKHVRRDEYRHHLNYGHLSDAVAGGLDVSAISDAHVLSLVLYYIEKEFHFSGDGIWDKVDAM